MSQQDAEKFVNSFTSKLSAVEPAFLALRNSLASMLEGSFVSLQAVIAHR